MALVNSNLTCSNSCYRCLSYKKRGQESCKFQFSPAPANSIQLIVQLVLLILIHWIVNLSGGQRYPSYEQPGMNSEFQTPELIPDQSTRKNIPGFRNSDYRTPRISINRLSFSELFDDISLMLNVRRLCVVVDSLISAAKVCDCVISAWY